MVTQDQLDLVTDEPGWTTDYAGRIICPHGNAIEPDLRSGHGDCGCSSPISDALGI